ncbi:hypothetical protein [Methylobrevis pamukkalensis]|uniref:Uncharacterized protein n=1 Tax=Methylobrevis pamukkalensis TaxID=1439726 RepID=A0A1E3H527_9HYPH|nr:hypothetical protein [Methylobrevis pamukkalensis]ODN70876.1 hypothetical protein A6302_01793 [Methylobrevis pamukkalensis]
MFDIDITAAGGTDAVFRLVAAMAAGMIVGATAAGTASRSACAPSVSSRSASRW